MKKLMVFASIVVLWFSVGVSSTNAHFIKDPKKALWHAQAVDRFFDARPDLARTPAGRVAIKNHKWLLRYAKERLYPPLYEAAQAWANSSAGRCVSSGEGGVTTNTGNGYYGKWQMDIDFQLAYGREFYYRWGVASNWPSWAQNIAAYRGYLARGWYPWPTTSRNCGLI